MADTTSTPVQLLYAPYDSGVFDARMGAGPLALRRSGAAVRLRERGHEVDEQVLEPTSAWRAEAQAAFELQRGAATAVAGARRAGRLPLLLAGNCNTTLGVLAGMAAPGRRLGLLWLDAHGDFTTPETTTTGFLDGQGLAMVVGRCWRTMTAGVEEFTPLPERQVLLVGARDLGAAEEAALRGSGVRWLPPAAARDAGATAAALDDLATRVDAVHVHVDLDVHDPAAVAPANGYAADDGLLPAEVRGIVRQAADRLPVISATLAAFDPSYDTGGRMRETALGLLDQLAAVGRCPAPGDHSRGAPAGTGVRDFGWDDLPALEALWRTTGQGVLPEDELRAVLRHGPGLLLVAEAADAGVVGVVLGTFDGRRGWIHRLAVHPGSRRSGVATRLVGELERRLGARGAPRTNLLVLPDNAAGLAFWERLGYVAHPDVLCSKPLEPDDR